MGQIIKGLITILTGFGMPDKCCPYPIEQITRNLTLETHRGMKYIKQVVLPISDNDKAS